MLFVLAHVKQAFIILSYCGCAFFDVVFILCLRLSQLLLRRILYSEMCRWWKFIDLSVEYTASIFRERCFWLIVCFVYFSILNMEAVRLFRNVGKFLTSRHHIPHIFIKIIIFLNMKQRYHAGDKGISESVKY